MTEGREEIRVYINGEMRSVKSGITVKELLGQLGIKTEYVAVEINRAIVRRDKWEETSLKAGDKVEIVHLVGGGFQLNSRAHLKDQPRSQRGHRGAFKYKLCGL